MPFECWCFSWAGIEEDLDEIIIWNLKRTYTNSASISRGCTTVAQQSIGPDCRSDRESVLYLINQVHCGTKAIANSFLRLPWRSALTGKWGLADNVSSTFSAQKKAILGDCFVSKTRKPIAASIDVKYSNVIYLELCRQVNGIMTKRNPDGFKCLWYNSSILPRLWASGTQFRTCNHAC